MTKPLARATITTDDGRWTVLIRAKRSPVGWRIKVTDRDGDSVAEMRVAAQVAELLRVSVSAAAGQPIDEVYGDLVGQP